MVQRHPHIFAMVLILWAAGTAAGQANIELQRALADFDDVLTTGRLADRAVPMVDRAQFHGSAEAPPVSPQAWRQLLHEMHQASVEPTDWPEPGSALDRARSLREDGMVALALLDVAYEALDPEAFSEGRITITDDRLVASNEWLVQHRAVAASALLPNIYNGQATSFILPADLHVVDESLTMEIDADDGLGFREFVVDQPLTVHYRSTGTRTLTVRLTDSHGNIRHARFEVHIQALVTPEPSATWPLTAGIPHDGAFATGEAFIYLADGHHQVTDPVVVVEGFDLDNSLNWPELYDLLNQQNLLEDLRTAGRDLVVLNFTEATDPIQRNAYLLVELLQTVDAQLSAGTTYPVVGASMGGLVTRYALSWLENGGGGHHCSLFVSFDVPHGGADIPLGVQSWLEFFQGESTEAAAMLERLNRPAARQMLLYHYTALDGSTAGPAPQYAAFHADLASVGGWPNGPRLVAVVNGSGVGSSQGFNAAAQVIEWEFESLLVDIVGNVWAVPDGSSHVVFDGLIDLIWPLPDTQRTVTVAGSAPWDGSPGGYRNTFAQLDDTSVPYGDLQALHDNHAFIPTVSSLAIPDVDPFFDLQGAPDLLGLTPFDAIYIPAENQEHVEVTVEGKGWLLEEILGSTTEVAGEVDLPSSLQLHGAAPNPFNPRTVISFSLPTPGPARLWIVDARGRRVRELLRGELAEGYHQVTWDGRDQSGRGVAGGVYLAVLEQQETRVAQRLTLVR